MKLSVPRNHRDKAGAFILTVFVAAAIWTPNTTATADAAEPRPNIVFIMADDLGYGDLGCYGAPDIKTPNLDRLASQGVRLTDFHSNGPVCTPTRCGLLTGRYQQRIGGLEWAIYPRVDRMGLPSKETTLPRLMKEAGYATAMAGKWHLGYRPDQQPIAHGFDRFFGLLSGNHDFFSHRENTGDPDLYLDRKPIEMEGYSTHLITRNALEFLDEMADRPFFLYVAYNAPHFPFQGPNDTAIELDGDKKNWTAGSRETYIAMVESMDAGIGEILMALDEKKLAGNTLIVFVSDNGGDRYSRNDPLKFGKGRLWEGGIRVPCIARLPDRIPAGSTLPQVGITMDWTATMLALASAKPPEDRPLDGIDLLPILSGQRPPHDRTLFWRRVDQREVKTHRAVRDGRWKYIDEPNGREYLYDLDKDVGEENNLAAAEPALAKMLKQKIDAWEDDVHPPLYEQSGKQVE